MLNYIVLVNRKNDIMVIDYETDIENCSPDIGYETDCSDWETNNKGYLKELKNKYYTEYIFDAKKVFSKCGIYRVEGYIDSCNTPDGYMETYQVLKVSDISDTYLNK